ncbi:MAG: 30S ribosomal protein S16 [Candidatus Sungbacteria bacterium]|uniref:Small ribosomal subunit protein bS16 n=1 Tax=Candidatus Sungiibacteriota bacterium TaxID=2750080 RepID=A0A9D6LQT8_9BACT|nr:30S ribosomal protein S16 [Candidatus Sungbacteria bacterium]
MLVIRFQRVGRKNDPAFRLVVTEHQNAARGKYLELLGSYHPKTKQTVLKSERIHYWLLKGAQVSDTAHNLLIKHKIIEAQPRPIKMKIKATATAAA